MKELRKAWEQMLREQELSMEKLSGILSEKEQGLSFESGEKAKQALEQKEKRRACLEEERKWAERQAADAEKQLAKLEAVEKEKAKYAGELEGQLAELKRSMEEAGFREHIEEEEQELEAARSQQREAALMLRMNQKTAGRLLKMEERRKQLDKRCQTARLLSDTACGELPGRQKVALEQYIQGFYLDQVLLDK